MGLHSTDARRVRAVPTRQGTRSVAASLDVADRRAVERDLVRQYLDHLPAPGANRYGGGQHDAFDAVERGD